MTKVPGLGGTLIVPAADYARSKAKWLAARRLGLGASDAAAVLGLSPWSTPYTVYADKTADEAPKELSTEAIFWGHQLEDPIARATSKKYPHLGKLAPSPGLLRDDTHPHILATLDRLLVPRRRPDADPVAVLECKNVGLFMYREHWLDGVPPVYYQLQVQQQLFVTGLDHGYITALVGGNYLPEPYLIERDDDAIRMVAEYTAEWWETHIVGRQAPPLILADMERINSIYRGDPDLDPITATPEVLAHLGEYIDARRRRGAAEAEMERAVFPVKEFMGDHTALLDPSGDPLATWKPTKTGRSFRTNHK